MARTMFLSTLSTLAGLALLTLAGPASASSPMGQICHVRRVVLAPDADLSKATQIEIHGVCALWAGDPKPGPFNYTAPQPGYMFFVCPVGQEATCRMEWKDIQRARGTDGCVGFGEMRKPGGTVRQESESPTKPDTYPIAMGVETSPYFGNVCEKLRATATPGGDDAGVKDSGAGGGAGAGGNGGSTGSGGSGGSSMGGGGARGTGGASGGSSSSGCSMTGAPGVAASASPIAALAAIASALGVARRRRRAPRMR